MATTTKRPRSLTVHTYQMGFGDCFLLEWDYVSSRRFVLIDFGTKGAPKKNGPPNMMPGAAADIKQKCNDKLDAVVVTHRHQDHISGFTTSKNGKGPGDIIRSLKPTIVIQPWTEEPEAKRDAEAPGKVLHGKAGFINSLANMQEASRGFAAEARSLARREGPRGLRSRFLGLQAEAMEGIKNESAVRNLETMTDRHAYVHHGSKSGLETILPGVDVTVLGPPTLKQSKDILNEVTSHPEFWMLQAGAASRVVRAEGVGHLFPRAPMLSETAPPSYARWLLPRIRKMRADSMEAIVRSLDDSMNNTSVILLFEVAGKAFLFPGDAQIENWQFTINQPALMKRLEDVVLYKVGHHGSRNATPRSVWAKLPHGKTKLKTVMSTVAGKYGESVATAVPRKTLVDALNANSTLLTTQDFKKGERSRALVFEL